MPPTGVAGHLSGLAEFLMSSRLRFAVRLCVPVLLLPLFGCGPARNEFAPLCPSVQLIPALADVTRYAGPGPTHDVTELIVQGRVTAVNGSCSAGDDASTLPAKVTVTISIRRGPAMKGRDVDVPVFLAVTEGDTVRDKQVFPLHVSFPENVEQLTFTSPPIELDLPVSKDVSGPSYAVIAGFQLSADELAANRQAASTR
jgi:hypothetical protein